MMPRPSASRPFPRHGSIAETVARRDERCSVVAWEIMRTSVESDDTDAPARCPTEFEASVDFRIG